MAEAISVSGAISGTDKTLRFETGKLALQSQGAVVASIGKTTVLVTANAAKGVRDGTALRTASTSVDWWQKGSSADMLEICRDSQ